MMQTSDSQDCSPKSSATAGGARVACGGTYTQISTTTSSCGNQPATLYHTIYYELPADKPSMSALK